MIGTIVITVLVCVGFLTLAVFLVIIEENEKAEKRERMRQLEELRRKSILVSTKQPHHTFL